MRTDLMPKRSRPVEDEQYAGQAKLVSAAKGEMMIGLAVEWVAAPARRDRVGCLG